MKNRTNFVGVFVTVFIFLLTACGGTVAPERKPAPTATAVTIREDSTSPVSPTEKPTEEIIPDKDVVALLSSNQVSLANLSANVDGETTGPIVTMRLVNQSGGELIVEIPCGLVFLPDDGDEQPLMIVESQMVAIPLGEEVEITPYVVCADIGASAPSLGATYTVGTLTEDVKMQLLVDCICDKGFDTSLDSFEGVNVQFAVWFVQMGGDPLNYIETHAEELSDAGSIEEFIGDSESDDAEYIEYFVDMFDMYIGEWLTTCGIEFEE